MIHFEYIFMAKYDVIEFLHENIDTEQFREKLWLAVLITPYESVKPYGSAEYISKKWNWSNIFLFSRYLIRFELEQKVTIGFLYWLVDYFLFSLQTHFFPASSLNFYMLGEVGTRCTMG